MRKYCAAGLVFLFLLGSLNAETATSNYERHSIASVGDGPDFTFNADLQNLVISIHNRIRPEEFKKNNGWSSEKYDQWVSFLENKGFLERNGEDVRLSCMVINDQDGKRLREYAEPVSQAITASILGMKEKVREAYSTTRLSGDYSFESMSFFLLSDVLLDNWQIHNIESQFLKAQRPLRNGKNYFFAFLENLSSSREAFGIYGNQPSGTYSVYGNNRGSIDRAAINQKISSFPMLSQDDNNRLHTIAGIFTPALLDILEENRNYANDVFRKTGYADEIRFEEFFIWWYHFIYSRATDILAEKGALTIPENGNFFYRYGK
jgi:hypothetical protein